MSCVFARTRAGPVELLGVDLGGKAYNLDERVQRVPWRDGWVYGVNIGPCMTSKQLFAGRRIRIEVSSSSFPAFERNLDTGGNNYDEAIGLVAHNVIHHGPVDECVSSGSGPSAILTARRWTLSGSAVVEILNQYTVCAFE